MSKSNFQYDRGVLIRRTLFFVVLLALSFANLFLFFRGLSTQQAMDQAQLGREIARGNGLTTKFIRPVDYEMSKEQQSDGKLSIVGLKDTYNSPLYPFINAAIFKIIGADDAKKWQITGSKVIYPLDRVVAGISTICFLLAIGVSYLLVARIFDPKIASATAILMLCCEAFWELSLSGLPQMFMLLLLSAGFYFAYRATERNEEEEPPYVSALLASVFFTLLSLSHYLGIWISLGYIIYAVIVFKPRGVIGLLSLLILILPLGFVIYRNVSITGNPFGVAFLNLYKGLGGGVEDMVMRSQNLSDYPLIGNSLILNLIRSTLLQLSDLIPFLGGIIVAPLFFVALLHPFKRPALANFRWLILLCFVLAAFGLSIYGVSNQKLDPNQVLILFAPIMMAYGLAFVSILWSKLPLVSKEPILRNAHFVIIIAISALPLVLSLPMKVKMGLYSSDKGVPHWPPYYAPALNVGLLPHLSDKEICFSDQPWAVAWYADRTSIWLPRNKAHFEKLEKIAAEQKTPVAGILISPSSQNLGSAMEVAQNYKDFTPLVINGQMMRVTYPKSVSPFMVNEKLEKIAARYGNFVPLVGYDMIFYSNKKPAPAN
jgi:hypothetical protein